MQFNMKHTGNLACNLTLAMIAIVLFFTPFCDSVHARFDPFIVKPYLQIGDAPHSTNPGSLVLMWHTGDRDRAWWQRGPAPPGGAAGWRWEAK